MAAGSYRKTLGQRGVWAFLWTQFLGAFNDNVFKIVVILIAATSPGQEATATSRSPARCSSRRSCSSPATPAISRIASASGAC